MKTVRKFLPECGLWIAGVLVLLGCLAGWHYLQSNMITPTSSSKNEVSVISESHLHGVKLPADIGDRKYDNTRKVVFISTFLPLIEQANLEILAERERIEQILAKPRPLSKEDTHFMAEMRNKYYVFPGANPEALLKKVDIIPPSLALAQAIVESGWGTSKFARKGNAYFGMQIKSTTISGLLPDGNPNLRIIPYRSPYHSIQDYMANLNRHNAYADFREIRAKARKYGKTPRGEDLAAGLLAYSTKREEYISLLRTIIAHNNLDWHDERAIEMAMLETHQQ